MSDQTFAMIVIPLILVAWSFVAFCAWQALKAKTLEEFLLAAFTAAFTSFLFCGPLCLVIWYILLLRSIWLSRPKPNNPNT